VTGPGPAAARSGRNGGNPQFSRSAQLRPGRAQRVTSCSLSRQWPGCLSTDDELLLAIQRRLANTDRTAMANAAKEERREAREKCRHVGANHKPEEEEIAEAA